MFLAGKRVHGKSIRLPITFPEKIATDPEIEEFVRRLKSGDTSAIGDVVRNYLRLSVCIAGQYATLAPEKRLDLASEGFVGIVTACHEVMQGGLHDNNLTAFVSSRIHAAIGKFIKDDHVVRIPHTTLRRKGEDAQLHRQGPGAMYHACYQQPPTTMLEIREMLKLAITTPIEEQIIRLRSQSYNDREIALQLGKSIAYVAKIRAAVEARYEELERK
jgi:hypothetical protein